MIQSHARGWGRRIDRFQGRALAKPLLQQEGCGGTVETTAPVTCQSMALTRCPGAAVLVHPGQGQLQGLGKTPAVATAVLGLSRGLPCGIQRQTHHQALNPTVPAELLQHDEITIKASPLQRGERCHRDAKGIATGQAYSPTAHIQTQHRTGLGHLSGDPESGMAWVAPGDASGPGPDRRSG